MVVIPARGGSKRLPGKNLFPFAGKPLIAHTIEQALAVPNIANVVVSSDDDDILRTAREYTDDAILAVQRPAHLARDETTTEAVLLDLLMTLDVDLVYWPEIIVLLQCTSPVREPQDIANCIRMIEEDGFDSVLSVVPFDKFLWSKAGLPLNYNPRKRPRSQDFDGQYVENGSIYAFKAEEFRRKHCRLFGNIGLYPMGKGEAFEIDTAFDAWLTESIMTGWKDAKARISWFEGKEVKEQWLALT